MTTKTTFGVPRLAEILPDACFRETHCGVVATAPEQVWEALHTVRWQDLRIGRVLTAIRGLTITRADKPVLDLFRPHALFLEDAPHLSVFVTIGKPWSPIPQSVHVDSLDDALAFHEPGWLKYGMDWIIQPLPDGRTFVETTTLCQPTDRRAKVLFTGYWGLIRVGSSVIRMELIDAIGRLSRR